MRKGQRVRWGTLAGMTATVLLAGCVMPMGQVGYDDPPWASPYARPLNSYPAGPMGQSGTAPGQVQVGRPPFPSAIPDAASPARVPFEQGHRAPERPSVAPEFDRGRVTPDNLPESDPNDGASLSVPQRIAPSRESEKPAPTAPPFEALPPAGATQMPELRIPAALLELKVLAAKNVGVNEPITYDVVLKNVSGKTLEDVRVDGEFDDELEFPGKTDKRVTRTFDEIEAGDRREFQLTLSALKSGRHCCQFTVSTEGGVQARQTVCVEASPRIVSVRLVGPRSRFVGTRAEFTIRAANLSGRELRNVRLTLHSESALRAFEWSQGGERDGSELTWNLGTLKPQEGIQLQAEFDCLQVSEETELTARVEIPDEQDQTSATLIRIHPRRPSLRIDLVDDRDPLAVGEETTFELTIQNVGLQPLEKCEAVVIVPKEFEAGDLDASVGSQPAQPTVTRQGGTLRITSDRPIPVDARLTLRLKAKAVQEGDAWLSARVTAEGVDTPAEIDEAASVTPARAASRR